MGVLARAHLPGGAEGEFLSTCLVPLRLPQRQLLRARRTDGLPLDVTLPLPLGQQCCVLRLGLLYVALEPLALVRHELGKLGLHKVHL